MAVIGAANPAAGVMATRPATAPVIAPSSDGLPLATRSTSVHDTAAAAVATKVLTKATAATPLAKSEEHTSELQSLMRISYAVFCLKKKTKQKHSTNTHTTTI